jgi:hypothetical protein
MSSLDDAPSDYSYGQDDEDVMSDDDYGFDTNVEGKKVRRERGSSRSGASATQRAAHAALPRALE